MGQRKSALEGLGVRQFSDVYRGRKVLLTGHTGFKGSWLSCWLSQLGARVTGLALSPSTSPNHWELLENTIVDMRGDIRDTSAVQDAMLRAQPEIVFHLAAQPLVRRSYQDPLESWSTNVIGTANLLEMCRRTDSVRAVVVITTDKVYLNNEWPWGYREDDRLGGHDPYSASKAACELVADSYRKSFWRDDDAALVATARAGNVIGGGDWSQDRLIPDLVRAVQNGCPLEIRSPSAKRPWQHVLECLSGYLILGQQLLEGRRQFADAWNFGPSSDDNRTVAEVLTRMRRHWPELVWDVSTPQQPHEAQLLYLDCAKSRERLRWSPVWSLEKALAMTAEWYRNHHATGAAVTLKQLDHYIQSARECGCSWIEP